MENEEKEFDIEAQLKQLGATDDIARRDALTAIVTNYAMDRNTVKYLITKAYHQGFYDCCEKWGH